MEQGFVAIWEMRYERRQVEMEIEMIDKRTSTRCRYND